MKINAEATKRLLEELERLRPLTDEEIDAILAQAPKVETSEAFRERALKRMAEAQRVRELKNSLITRRGGKYR